MTAAFGLALYEVSVHIHVHCRYKMQTDYKADYVSA